MPRFRSLLPVLAVASLGLLPAFAAPPVHPSRSRLQPCKDGPAGALCGEYQVWENRVAKTGRKITLEVLLLPALGPNPKPDPIIAFGGGPGQAAGDLVGVFGPEARRDRD